MSALTLSINNISIRQDQDGRFCLNDLHKAAGNESKHQPSKFLETQQTQELICELENFDTGNPVSKKSVEIIRGRGKRQGTYAVKEIVYAYAMWISAKFHLAVIRAYDSLVSTPQLEPPTLTKAQVGELFNIVCDISADSKKIRAAIWSRFQRHFTLSSYKDLPAEKYEEALTYLERLRGEYAHAKPEVRYTFAEFKELMERAEVEMFNRTALEALIAEKLAALMPEKSTPLDSATQKLDYRGAKALLKKMRAQIETLSDAPQRVALTEAAEQIDRHLVSAWTDMDEALNRILNGVNFLRHWRGLN